MENKSQRIVIFVLAFVFAVLPFWASASLCLASPQSNEEEQSDSLIRLVSASTAQMFERGGDQYRRVIGSPAIFLHNGTYLYCDTAEWNVTTNVLNSWGDVQICQEETRLFSDRLLYLVDSSLAQFRGTRVRLENADGDVLLTNNLDYYTQDSIAHFFAGGAMKDKTGQIIESVDGRYEAIIKKFTFNRKVNMLSDTTFIKCDSLEYYSSTNMAYFYRDVHAWHDEYMLSSDNGYYNRDIEEFLFKKSVHLQSDSREGWSDSLIVDRLHSNFDLLGHAQLNEEEHSTYAMAGKIAYLDTFKRITMSRLPAIAAVMDSTQRGDTLFFSADTIIYYTQMIGDMADSLFRQHVDERRQELFVDPVGEYRKKAAEEAAKAAQEALENDPDYIAKQAAEAAKKAAEDRKAAAEAMRAGGQEVDEDDIEVPMVQPDAAKAPALADSLAVGADSLAVGLDSLGHAAIDSTAIAPPTPKDSTKVDFMVALGRIKVFKSDIQITCDSLLYNNFDSLARLFKTPIIWKDRTQQFNADSISMVVKDGTFDRLFMMSNSFVQIQDADTLFFNQIRSAEMIAYFDTTTNLSRYDALGDATALFFLEENGAIATANRKECKMLSAEFLDGEIQKCYYYDTPKSNAYPVAVMTAEEKQLKGFSWKANKRPASRYDVTLYKVKESERSHYSSVARPEYRWTNHFFPGYMQGVHTEIEQRKWEKAHPKPKPTPIISDLKAVADTAAVADSTVAPVDSLTSAIDTSAIKSGVDSLATGSDSLKGAAAVVVPPTAAELRQQKAAERKAALEAKRKAAEEKREARWKKAEEKEKAKLAAKEQKKKEALRRKKLKALKDQLEREARENEMLNKYLEDFRSGKLRPLERPKKEPKNRTGKGVVLPESFEE